MHNGTRPLYPRTFCHGSARLYPSVLLDKLKVIPLSRGRLMVPLLCRSLVRVSTSFLKMEGINRHICTGEGACIKLYNVDGIVLCSLRFRQYGAVRFLQRCLVGRLKSERISTGVCHDRNAVCTVASHGSGDETTFAAPPYNCFPGRILDFVLKSRTS